MLFEVSQVSSNIELVFANSDRYINVYPSYHQVGGMNYRNVNQTDWVAAGNQFRWAAPMPQITEETIPVIQLVYSYGSSDTEQQQQYFAFKSITNVETISGSMYLYTSTRPTTDFRIRFKVLNKLDLAILLDRMFGIGIGYEAAAEELSIILTGYNPITGQSGMIPSVLPAASNSRSGIVQAGIVSRLKKLEKEYDSLLTTPFRIDGYSSASAPSPVSTYYADEASICSVPANTWYKECSIYTATDAEFTDAARLFYQQQATGLDLTHVYTGNVTSFSYALACNSLLQDITGINLLDTRSAVDISYMFKDDIALTKVDLSELCLDNVTDISGLFQGCTALTELNLSSIDFTREDDQGQPIITCPDIFTGVPDDCMIWVAGETQRNAILGEYPNLTDITYN